MGLRLGTKDLEGAVSVGMRALDACLRTVQRTWERLGGARWPDVARLLSGAGVEVCLTVTKKARNSI